MSANVSHPRWYRRGARVQADEIGAVILTAPQSGWYLAINHYGRYKLIRMPWGFWRGLRERRRVQHLTFT